MFKNLCRAAAVAMALVVLGGCATRGTFEGSSDPKRMAIVVCTERPCTVEQRVLAGDVLIEAAHIVEREMSGPAEAALARGFANAVASAVATALTVANPVGGTIMAITAADNASQGVTEGMATFRYARVYAVTTIADLLREDRIKQKVPGYEVMEYVHIVAAFVPATTPMKEFRPDSVRPRFQRSTD